MIEKVCALVLKDWQITIKEIYDELEISMGLCEPILTKDLGMKTVAAKFIIAEVM